MIFNSSTNEHSKLPLGWIITTLQEISSQINPGFPSGKHNQDEKGVPHLRPMNINSNGKIDLNVVKYVQVKMYDPLLAGDVLFNNTNSPQLLGKTTYVNENTNWAYSNHMTRIRFNSSFINSAWIAYYLHHLFIQGFFRMNCVNHVNQASINSTFLATKVLIPLPPLNEQKRIISKLEELFTKLDTGMEYLRKTQILLKQYRQSVLKYAFEGRLTEKWREKNRNRNLNRPSQEDIDIKTEFKLNAIPFEWFWDSIKSIADFIGSGITPKGGKNVYVEKGIPFIRSQNVYPNGLHFEDIAYVTKEQHNKMSRTHIKPYDVLLNITGASIGRCTFVPPHIAEANVNQHVCIIRPNKTISAPFLSYWLNSFTAQQIIFNMNKGVTRQGLNYSHIRSLPLPITSLEEQLEIVKKIDSFFSLINHNEKIIHISIVRSKQLYQSILEKAFEGKLVPQDSNDEPASFLLENLKQEKSLNLKRQNMLNQKTTVQQYPKQTKLPF